MPRLQFGSGHALDVTMLEATIAFALDVLADVLGIKEVATAPARQRAKTETRTMSFITMLPPSSLQIGIGVDCNEIKYSGLGT